MKYLNIILFSFLISCSSTKKTNSSQFVNLYTASNSTIIDKNFFWIRNNQDYINAIEKLQVDEQNYESLLDVNFETNDICIVFLGKRSTGGYSIEVDRVTKKQKKLYIKTVEKGPSRGDSVTMSITYPFCVTVIPKSKGIILK